MTTSCANKFPFELLSLICAALYYASVSPTENSLDPFVTSTGELSTALPSAYTPSFISEPVARKTLLSLCLVDRAWHEAAKSWLWKRVEIRYPASWLALVHEVAGGDGELTDLDVDQSIREVAQAALVAASPSAPANEEATRKLQESIMATLCGPDGSIPPELLTPPVSREPSPRRLRQKSQSPARWKIIRSISEAVQKVMHRDEPGIYVPILGNSLPGRYVRLLSFNHFRTIGMRRSLDEAVNSRFVTADRLRMTLKELPNLTAFGATEYMDGALNIEVMKELLLRGSPSRGRGRSRTLTDSESFALEEDERDRLRECRELVALDLTGCVSAVFFSALTDFVNTYLSQEETDSSSQQYSVGQTQTDHSTLTFPGMERLGLRGIKSIPPDIINPFISAFPSLTHLDLSGTRVTPALLSALGSSRTLRLQSLGLARCVALTGESITEFLVRSPVTSSLTEITLYGDATYPSPLSEDDLRLIIKSAPSFTSGLLKYLDISSSPVTSNLLQEFVFQPSLRSLGLSYIFNLPLSSICDFLLEKAPNVEVLSMISTSPELGVTVLPRQVSLAIHAQLVQRLCMNRMSALDDSLQQAPTRLRVIELAIATLGKLGAGIGSWRIIRSKGGRAWYVDTASGWTAETGSECFLRRDLPPTHPLRIELEKLADANGNVSSGVGWHARKLEIIYGHGLLGREDGLYGAVSFAYQG